MSVVRVGHEATPLPGSGNRPGSRGVNRLAARRLWAPRSGQPGGRASVGARRNRMTAASIYGSPPKLLCGGKSARRTRFPWGEADVFREETEKSSRRAWRGRGPSAYARIAEITSGRAISQQGLATTCKDRLTKEETEAGERDLAWRMSPSERRRRGNALREDPEILPTRGNTPAGPRGSRHWVANEPGPWEDMTGTAWSNLPSGGRSWWRTSRPEGKPTGRCTTHLPSPTTWVASWSSRRGGRQTTGARGVCGSALKLPPRWAGLVSDKWCAEPRSAPDSGNPTVRDRRAALRTVTSHASGVLVRALNFEPDNGRPGCRDSARSPAPAPTSSGSGGLCAPADTHG